MSKCRKSILTAGLTVMAVVGLVAGLTACGSSTKSSSNSAPASASTGAAEGSASLSSIVQFVGGTAGSANQSLSPVEIGWANQESWLPNTTKAAQAAVSFLNAEAGGIGGHPVKLDTCAVSSAQDFQACGVRFANNTNLKAVANGLARVDDTSFYQALGSTIPILQSGSNQAPDFNQANAVNYQISTAVLFKGFAAVPTSLPKNTPVKIMYTPSAISSSSNHIATLALQDAGYTNIGAVPVTETASVPDVTSTFQTAGVKNGDILVAALTDAQCIAVDVALKSLNVTPGLLIATQGCADTPVLNHFKGAIPSNWRIVSQFTYPLATSAPDVASYTALIKKYGAPLGPNDGGAPQGAAAIINLVKTANQVGYNNLSDRSAFVTALKHFTGPAYLMPGPIQCGWLPQYSSVCATAVPILSFANGTWTQSAPSLK